MWYMLETSIEPCNISTYLRAEQAEYKSTNEIYLLPSDAMFILCAYLLYIYKPRMFRLFCAFHYTNYSSVNYIFNKIVMFLKVKDFARSQKREL